MYRLQISNGALLEWVATTRPPMFFRNNSPDSKPIESNPRRYLDGIVESVRSREPLWVTVKLRRGLQKDQKKRRTKAIKLNDLVQVTWDWNLLFGFVYKSGMLDHVGTVRTKGWPNNQISGVHRKQTEEPRVINSKILQPELSSSLGEAIYQNRSPNHHLWEPIGTGLCHPWCPTNHPRQKDAKSIDSSETYLAMKNFEVQPVVWCCLHDGRNLLQLLLAIGTSLVW